MFIKMMNDKASPNKILVRSLLFSRDTVVQQKDFCGVSGYQLILSYCITGLKFNIRDHQLKLILMIEDIKDIRIKATNSQVLSTISKTHNSKLYFLSNDFKNLEFDDMLSILLRFMWCKVFSYDSYTTSNVLEHCHTPSDQRSRKHSHGPSNSAKFSTSGTRKRDIPWSLWYQALAALNPKDIFCWIFQILLCLHSHIEKSSAFSKKQHSETPDIAILMIQARSSITCKKENGSTSSPYNSGIYDAVSDITTDEKNHEVKRTLEKEEVVNEFLYKRELEVSISLRSRSVWSENCTKLVGLPYDLSMDKLHHIVSELINQIYSLLEIIKLSKSRSQSTPPVLNVFVLSEAEDELVKKKHTLMVELADFYKDSYVIVQYKYLDRPICMYDKCEQLGDDSDYAQESNQAKPETGAKHEKSGLKRSVAKTILGQSFCGLSKCATKCINFTKNSVNISWNFTGPAMSTTSRAAGFGQYSFIKCKESHKIKVSLFYILQHELEDCFTKDFRSGVTDRATENSHPVLTQNSINTVSCIDHTKKCGSSLPASDHMILSKLDHKDDLPCDLDIVKKSSLDEISDREQNSRIYQEVPEEQKLLQPPEFDPANKSFRISTLINSRIAVPHCSIESISNAGFYFGVDRFIHCFRCDVRFSIEEFCPRDPYLPSWHGRSCNGTVSRTRPDGRISDEVRDPPGQQSIYIPSGNVRDERYRLSTFARYPVSSVMSKVNLAKAGFYFMGYSDKVKCFSCGRTVEHWTVSDNPMDTTWHKSSCAMQKGIASGNIPMQSQFVMPTSAQSSNQFTVEFQRNAISSGLPSSSRDARGRPRSAGSTSQPRKQWRMANVISSDHRRHLTNLFLNRELDRLASFTRWPTGRRTVSPEALAKTGFFYLGDADRTQCFSCGGVLRNWTANDRPEVEHRQNFPQCEMVQGIETHNVPVPLHAESREDRERNFPCRHPTNPHMRSEATRLDTFDRRWPMGRTQATPDEIAHAGFFFLGQTDRTKCWYCNGGLQNWEYDDAPWAEHAKWFPNCQFLLRMKGQNFVHRHLAANAHLQRPVISKQEGSPIDQSSSGRSLTSSTPAPQDVPPYMSRNISQPAASPTIIDPREEIRKQKELVQNVMKNSDIVKNIIVMGFDRKIIEALLEDKVATGTHANNEDIYDSMSELLDDVMNKEQEQMERLTTTAAAQAGPSIFPSFSSTAPNPSFTSPLVPVPGKGKYSAYYDIDDDDDDMNMYASTVEAAPGVQETTFPPIGAVGNLQDTESMQEAMAKIEEESLCKICFSSKADMVFLPCSHMCCCMECTQAIRQCPLCRKTIERAIKTYTA